MMMDPARVDTRVVRARNKKNMSKDFFTMISIHRAIGLTGKRKTWSNDMEIFCQHLV
jgi:hypothetical protein